jgi:ferredoxin
MQAQRNGTPMLASSGYVAVVDEGLCAGCGECTDACQFAAISVDDIRPHRCRRLHGLWGVRRALPAGSALFAARPGQGGAAGDPRVDGQGSQIDLTRLLDPTRPANR